MTITSKGYGDYVVFVESKALRGRSKQEYLRQVRKLGEHYAGRKLAGVTEREVFDYLVHRREVEKLRPSTLNQAVVALRMFYRDYLGRRWALWERFEIRRDHPLPVVLTRKETRRLLGSVRSGRFRAVLALIYHCGLRVGEAVALMPGHIDAPRGVVPIVEGKGGRMREVPISCAMVERLRRYRSFHRMNEALARDHPQIFARIEPALWQKSWVAQAQGVRSARACSPKLQASRPNAARHGARRFLRPPHETDSNNKTLCSRLPQAEEDPSCSNLPTKS